MITFEGKTTDPDIVAVLDVPRQKPCRVIGNDDPEFAVSVCVALLHALFGTDAVAVITQAPLPMLMVAPPLTSTDVVLVAVATQSPVDVTTVGLSPKLFVQLLNVGPAPTPAEFVVVAVVPVAFVKRSTVHETTAEPEVSDRLPWPCTTVPCGSQLAAEAVVARIRAATMADPIVLMLRMFCSFCRSP
jgi:hypothetical protein